MATVAPISFKPKIGTNTFTFDIWEEEGSPSHVILTEGWTIIANGAFDSTLVTIHIPKSVGTIQQYAFRNCTSLKEVTFGNDSDLHTIGGYAFENCNKLESFVIHANKIGANAFKGCTNLKSIRFSPNLNTYLNLAENTFTESGLETVIMKSTVLEKMNTDRTDKLLFGSKLPFYGSPSVTIIEDIPMNAAENNNFGMGLFQSTKPSRGTMPKRGPGGGSRRTHHARNRINIKRKYTKRRYNRKTRVRRSKKHNKSHGRQKRKN